MAEQVTRDVLTKHLGDPRIVRAFEELLDSVPALFLDGRLTIEAPSDTQLVFSYRGSDGIVRSAALTLS